MEGERGSPHRRFFSSLDYVQKRLSREPQTTNSDAPTPSPSSSKRRSAASESHGADPPSSLLGSPLFLLHDPQPTTSSSTSPPPDFLSQPDPEQDEIQKLMDLLDLPEEEEGGEGECRCSGGGFYSRIAGVRGPKCERERRRVDRWIGFYRRTRSEPARLAYLLLGKATAGSGAVAGYDPAGVGFPKVVEDHLDHDPPVMPRW